MSGSVNYTGPDNFMIGWYVDAGYCLISSLSNLSISDITFTDMNRPFVIPTKTISQQFSNFYKLMNESISLQEAMVNIFEDDFYTLYGIPGGRGDGLDLISSIVPSMPLAYPNLHNFAVSMGEQNFTSTYRVILRFPKLKKLAYTGGIKAIKDDGTTSVLYSDGSSGLLTVYTYIGKFNGTTREDIRFVFRDIVNYEENLPIDNWESAICDLVGTSSKDSQLSVRLNENNYYFVQYAKALFGNMAIPDFNGPPGPSDPYSPGGNSGPGELPPGTFDNTSDPIPLPSLPSLSAANTGFTRIYNPTLSQVQALAQYLWTDETVIETIWNHIKQYFEDPMQAIIGFNLVPVPVPDGGTKNFALMYIDTGVQMTAAASQFVDVDCGSVQLQRYYGSALDQSPYTKVSCFLPYIGTVHLNTDEVMGTTLSVNYRVDIVSGSCVASILVDGNVLYQYSGHCAITIPFSSADFSSYVNAAIQVGKLIGNVALSAGASMIGGGGVSEAAQETSYIVTKTTETTNTARNPSTGRQITTGTTRTVQTTEEPIIYPQSNSNTKASFAGLSPSNITNTVGQVIGSKPTIQRSGAFSGNSGYLGVRRPYLIIERPNMCLPENFQALNGYPAMITMQLGECQGFTRVQQVQLTGMYATNPEQAEILELLKMGVVF